MLMRNEFLIVSAVVALACGVALSVEATMQPQLAELTGCSLDVAVGACGSDWQTLDQCYTQPTLCSQIYEQLLGVPVPNCCDQYFYDFGCSPVTGGQLFGEGNAVPNNNYKCGNHTYGNCTCNFLNICSYLTTNSTTCGLYTAPNPC